MSCKLNDFYLTVHDGNRRKKKHNLIDGMSGYSKSGGVNN